MNTTADALIGRSMRQTDDALIQLREALEMAARAIAERDRLGAFALSLLNPEENGHAVPAHIRDEARKALGRRPVETGGRP